PLSPRYSALSTHYPLLLLLRPPFVQGHGIVHVYFARAEFPLLSHLGILIVIITGGDYTLAVAGAADFHVAGAGGPLVALQFDHVVVNKRVWVQAGEPLLVGFEQGLLALGRGLVAAHIELAVVGEEADNSRDVLFPHVVTVLERQVADR